MYQSTKKPGNILSAFNSDSNSGSLPPKFLELKKEINPTNVEESWTRLIAEFNRETKIISEFGNSVIPTIDFKDIEKNGGKIPEEISEKVKKSGVAVIRNVVSESEAISWKNEVRDYINKYRNKIVGFPEENPVVWEVYWSKAQFKARSHPNFMSSAKAMNQLWHAEPECGLDLTRNLTYCDRLRIREPGDTSFSLGEHIDGGSIERWEDLEYRKCYKNILNGDWENHDAFDATHRASANMDLHNCSGGCSMFRTFQGWLSLSEVGPGGGTLKVCPLLKLTSAYILLRPFLNDVINSSDFCGAIPGAQQLISKEKHPHIVNTTIPIPKVYPGDCVFWHCDLVHAVEEKCENLTDSSVFYIPATPFGSKNLEYSKCQRAAFISGLSPPDFPLNNCEAEIDERAKVDDLSREGLQLMGF